MADWDEELGNVGRFAAGAGVVLIGIAAITGKCKRDTPILDYDKNKPAQETGINNNYNGQTTINNNYINGNNNNVRQNNTVNSNVRSNNTTGSHNTRSTNDGAKSITPVKTPKKSAPIKSIDDTLNTPVSQAVPESNPEDIMQYAGFRNGNAYFENGLGAQLEINPRRYAQVTMVNGAFIYGNYMLDGLPLEMRQIIFENNRAIDNQLRNDPFARTVGRVRNVPDSRGAFSGYWSNRAMNRMNTTLMVNVRSGGARGTYVHPGWNYGGYMGGPYINGRH